MRTPLRFTFALLTILCATRSFAAEAKDDPSLLTVARIYGSGEFHSESASGRWLPGGSGLIEWQDAEGPGGGRDLVCRDPKTGEPTVLIPATRLVPPGETSPLEIDGYTLSENRTLLLIYTNSKRVWRRNTRGDYWVLDRTSHELKKLGGDAKSSTLMFAKLSPTGRHAAYVRERNLYVEDLRDGGVKPLTTDGGESLINGTSDWVYEEELSLRDAFRWSPDGKSIAYWQFDTTGVRVFTMINNTDGLYPRTIPFEYPKVGQQNASCRVGVVSVEGGDTRWMNVSGDPRNHYIARMEWATGSQQLVIQQLNRLQNTNRVMLAEARSGEVETILTETDDAWLRVQNPVWFDDGQRFTWLSERDGWRHVYLVSRDGKQVELATPGEFDVIELLHVDEERECLYFLASPDNPTQRYLYSVGLDGKGLTRLTPADQPGSHRYEISPNGRWAIHSRSSFDTPGPTEMVSLPKHESVRVMADNKGLLEKLAKLKRRPSEFFRVDIGDGVLLDGWCIKPHSFDPNKKYPLLVYVYGEPAGQTVLDRYGGSGYLWHLMLAQQGYLVISIDNRGTPAPRGRAWRKSVYRQVGVIAPKDQAAAIRKLIAERPYIDTERIGVWGWSGGGSMSLNAIFKYPDLYRTAMSVAPVPNQRYYDTIYQERYMGLPDDNAEGFYQGSPINFAHQLEGNLLLVHGTGDDNCHYQTTELLINELIRHNKPFTMMAYPNRSHSIREGAGTTRHLRELLTRYLKENLPPGPAAD